jgi:hypothetical protein
MNLVLNSNNVVAGSNNTRYKYTFIAPLEIKENAELAISNMTIPYSWFNITAINNNNEATLEWAIGGSIFYFDLPLKDGYYSVPYLNYLVQHICVQNGLYLIDDSGNYVYYLTITYDTTLYAVRVTGYSIPTSLPAGWIEPSNWAGYPSAPYTPRLLVNLGFAKLIGFSTTTIGTIIPFSVISTQVPQGSIVNSIIVRSNLINNNSGFPTDELDTIPITSSFGTNINYLPHELKWIKCIAGKIQSFEVYFCDQNLNPMYILDNNVCISLLLKN